MKGGVEDDHAFVYGNGVLVDKALGDGLFG